MVHGHRSEKKRKEPCGAVPLLRQLHRRDNHKMAVKCVKHMATEKSCFRNVLSHNNEQVVKREGKKRADLGRWACPAAALP